MKRALFLILVLLYPGLGQLLAQTASVPLGMALNELRRNSNIFFSYDAQSVGNRSVKPLLTDFHGTLEQALNKLLENSGLHYRKVGNTFLIEKIPNQAGGKPSEVPGKVTLSGYLREKGSQEWLPGANVSLMGTSQGTHTNQYGFYSVLVPANEPLSIAYSFVGYQPVVQSFVLTKNTILDIELVAGQALAEVVVSGQAADERLSERVQMSQVAVPITQVQKIPALLGEKDALKVLQLMPGVQKGSEGQSGLYVRGGGPDQNLIILDDAPVYNANHLFGFFSVFNTDALRSVELTKGGFPAQYGGRLSSVVNMTMKEGRKDTLHGAGGIGTVASRLTLEGPLIKNKASFLVSGRRTYVDLLLAPFLNRNTDSLRSRLGYYFYDLNIKLNVDFNHINKLYLSGYFGRDVFYFDQKDPTGGTSNYINWQNATGTLRWNHLFNERLFANTTFLVSNYTFNIQGSYSIFQEKNYTQLIAYRYASGIRDLTLKLDLDYFVTNHHTLKIGVAATQHRFMPDVVAIRSAFQPSQVGKTMIDAWEGGLYIEDNLHLGSRLQFNVGNRFSTFWVRNQRYFFSEPRLAGSFILAKTLALKASYALMHQYVHLLSNTGLGLPTDLWVPSTERLKPQRSEQVSVGLAKDLNEKGFACTLEAYYKRLGNIISYREGTSFVRSTAYDGSYQTISWEDKVTTGQGKSYGLEVLVQKKTGRLSGWIGYTWSKTRWQFPELNFGKAFFPRYDRRHDVSVVAMYELTPTINLSATWVYGTGNALTMPVALSKGYTHLDLSNLEQSSSPDVQKFGEGNPLQIYGERNSFRAEPFHRLDIAVQFIRKKSKFTRTWEVGVYNAYNRKNPFYYQQITKQQNGSERAVLQRVALFPIIPSVTYNLKF